MPQQGTIPKSTAKLLPGDVCFFPRADGRFVPFAYLCRQGNSKSYFQDGLLNVVVAVPRVDDLPARVKVVEYALTHIDCFERNQTPIVGNIADRITRDVLDRIQRESHSQEVGSKTFVWGHFAMMDRASRIEA